ncbi:MAG: DUF3592 domain-containing protein [Armatimonadota bacterium]
MANRQQAYRFATLDGQEIIGRRKVKAHTWNAMEEGTRIRIAYLPNDPSRHRLADERDAPGALMVFWVGGVVAAFGGALVRSGVVKYRRQQRLRLEGVPARATVTAVRETRSRHNRRRLWQVTYRYKDRQGQPHQGESGYLLPEGIAGLRTGDTRAVRYDPNSPADSIWVGDEKR